MCSVGLAYPGSNLVHPSPHQGSPSGVVRSELSTAGGPVLGTLAVILRSVESAPRSHLRSWAPRVGLPLLSGQRSFLCSLGLCAHFLQQGSLCLHRRFQPKVKIKPHILCLCLPSSIFLKTTSNLPYFLSIVNAYTLISLICTKKGRNSGKVKQCLPSSLFLKHSCPLESPS